MEKNNITESPDFAYQWCSLCKDYFPIGEHDHELHNKPAGKIVNLTALMRWAFGFIVLLVVVLFTVGV